MHKALCLILFSLSFSACGLTPWVEPFERGRMADPIMSFSRDPISETYIRHVFEVREAARGAVAGAGGGCGCN